MTSHELAKKLLEGPDVEVVIQGYEPNDDTFDVIYDVSNATAWRFVGTPNDECLFKRRMAGAPVIGLEVVVLR